MVLEIIAFWFEPIFYRQNYSYKFVIFCGLNMLYDADFWHTVMYHIDIHFDRKQFISVSDVCQDINFGGIVNYSLGDFPKWVPYLEMLILCLHISLYIT